MRQIYEGRTTYEHSLNHALSFFAKAGSLFEKRKSFYGKASEDTALSLFQKSFIVDPEISMKLLFYLRDCRGGSGNRSGTRSIYKWLAQEEVYNKWLQVNLHLLPLYGRWDDLRSLFKTPLQTEAATFWATAMLNGDTLACKWADRKDKPLLYAIRAMRPMINNEATFRKFLAHRRKNHIVEYKMCSNLWNEIKYETVPSVAMARYTKAFNTHDAERFEAYKRALETGEKTVHADVLFPHDCVRTVRYGDKKIADAQFDALPNYMEGSGERIIVIADTSGSMSSIVSGRIRAVDVSQGLALYCSAKIERDNPFHKKYIQFESESTFTDWGGKKFSQVVDNPAYFNGAVGGTRIDTALMGILRMAQYFNLLQEQMPTTLLIISDMQFHYGVDGNGTEVDKCIEKWIQAGYEPPKIVYWNTAGYQGSPATAFSKNVALVSGFSPSVLKNIFAGKDLTPVGVMLETLKKYEIIIPK